MSRANYMLDTKNPVKTIIARSILNSAIIISPLAYFAGSDEEESAASILNNLYDKDGNLDVGIAHDLVALAVVHGAREDVALSVLYSALNIKDRTKFYDIGEKIFKMANGDAKSLNDGKMQPEEQKKDSAKKENDKPAETSADHDKQEKKDTEEAKKDKPKREPVKQAPKADPQQPAVATAAEAANGIGFNINKFLNPQNNVPNPGIPPFVAPQQSQQQQAQNQEQPGEKYDPMPDATQQERVDKLKKHYKFIEGAHKVDTDQINALLMLLNNGQLKDAVKKHNAKCRANNIFMTEIPVPDDKKDEFDFCFRITTKDPKHPIVVLFNSTQIWYPQISKWGNKVLINVEHNH